LRDNFCLLPFAKQYSEEPNELFNMIEWNDIDLRLAALGLNRAWLAEKTPYSKESIRQALAPKGSARSERMQIVLSRAIEDEEARRAAAESQLQIREVRPGILEIFQSDEELHRSDLASRSVGAPSLLEFCHDVIVRETDRILAESVDPYRIIPLDPELRVADDDASSA